MTTRTWVDASGAALLALLPAAGAVAQSLTVDYFTISSTDPQQNTMCCGTYNNEVLSTLGPDGLPLLNPAFSPTSTAQIPSGVNVHSTAEGQELTFWSTALNPYVKATGTGTASLPFSNQTFYPPNGTGYSDGGGNGYQSAVFSGTLGLTTSEKVSFNIGADDFAFAYVDGSVVCDLGGVHGDTAGDCTTETLGAGNHSLEIFYADFNQTGAAFTFGLTGTDTGVTVTGGGGGASVPEPGVVALLGLGLGGVMLSRRRPR